MTRWQDDPASVACARLAAEVVVLVRPVLNWASARLAAFDAWRGR